MHLDSNRLISWALGLFCAYWAFGYLSEPLWFSVVVSACLFVGGVFVAARTVPRAAQLIWRDSFGPGELGVIGLALFSTGAIWSGAFNMAYAYFDRPEAWIGPASSFGRGMMTVGFFAMFLFPEATSEGVRWPRWYILLAAGAVISAVSFLIGYTLNSHGDMSELMTRAPKLVDLMQFRRT